MTQRARPYASVAIALGAATFLGLIASAHHYAAMAAEGTPMPWRHAMVMELPFWYAAALLTPALVEAVRRWPDRSRSRAARVLEHTVIALAWIVAQTFLEIGARRLIGTGLPGPQPTFIDQLWSTIVWTFPVKLLAYVGVLGAIYAVTYYARFRERELAASQLETRLAETRLQLLRAQLNPHFLFNAMNSIAVLTREQRSSEAVAAVLALSGLLRDALRDDGRTLVPLREELGVVSRYVDVEQVRFAGQLAFSVDVPPELLDSVVPSFVLQPLVENAIRHGRAPSDGSADVAVRARATGEMLTLTVWDDGAGPHETTRPSDSGIGLRNVRERLAQLYGSAQSFSLTRAPSGGTIAEIAIPLSHTPA